MSDITQDKITAFDTIFTNNQIQMLKILLTYMEPSQQKTMAIYIKFMELQYTIAFFRHHPYSAHSLLPKEDTINTSRLCDELMPLCGHKEQEKLQNIKNICQNMENMQEMLQMLQMMKELFPEGENPFDTDPSSLISNLSDIPGQGMNGMDISQVFEMFQGIASIPK